MFTGIVEEMGTIVQITRRANSGQMVIEAKKVLEDCIIGDSIAISGACLTVIEVDANSFVADVSPETLRRTNLSELKQGDKVNLERSLRLQDRLGGHLVLGHVDEVGIISRLQSEDSATLMRVTVSSEAMRYIVFKGSVCVDGVSLTVANLSANAFEVSLIPYTKRVTTMGLKRVNDKVNIEVDILARYIERLLSQGSKPERIDMAFLSEHGFA
ncbi:TPA: riboflavin synthase [Candidatus Poribacteria bacterium]|nr:riboflavin synthase [Candidatus Poribacteria bacterium]